MDYLPSDSYIDLDTWNYYVKETDGWTLKGNIKGASSESSSNPQGLSFYLTDNNTYYVGLGNARYLTTVAIPETYNGLPVTGIVYEQIDYSIFENIVIPNTVTFIGDQVFNNCSTLTSINIPDSVTSIGAYAFYGCSSLMSINIPNSVTSIGERAFANCTSLKSIVIPESVVSMSYDVFSGC